MICVKVRLGSRLCKNGDHEVGRRSQLLRGIPILCLDRFHQSANAQNAHYPFHVVGQDMQRHLGADVLERFHLEVRRSHPRLYRAEWMLDRLAAQRASCLGSDQADACTASRTASCSQRDIRRSLPVVHWPFSAQPWHTLVQIAPQSLAVFFTGVVID